MQIYTPDQLNDLMSESDYIVTALPHTDKTEKLVDAAAINSMKQTGVFVNIGRGQTVDEEALVRGTICSPLLVHVSNKTALGKTCADDHDATWYASWVLFVGNTGPSPCGQ